MFNQIKSIIITIIIIIKWKEGNVIFNDTLNTFYLPEREKKPAVTTAWIILSD